jgi:23S rRNA pseudouridine2605 synthase
VLAAAGLASRRAAEAWIRGGRVTVNGHVARLGESVDPSRDIVCVDGERVGEEPLQYWLVNKPLGVVTTVRDPEGRAAILDLVPGLRARLFPVGRLDRASSGLVLLTNDGPLHHALLHPSHGIEREYFGRLAAGVELEDGRTAPARVARAERDEASTSLYLTMIEGRKRQIRRALEALGHPVIALHRVRFGPLALGRLASGAARQLSAAERAQLLRAAGLEGSRARSSRAKPPRRRGKAQASKPPRV